MRPYKKSRSEVSLALIRLRNALGMSQAEFAVTLLKMAPMTISRMETVSPPEGEMLFKLSQIAEGRAARGREHSQELWEIAEHFRVLYLQELVEKIRHPLTIFSRQGKAAGFLVSPLENADA